MRMKNRRLKHQPDTSVGSHDYVLEVNNLYLDISGDEAQEALIENVSFNVRPGETVALIGESGCGKTMTAMALLGLLPKAAGIRAGEILFDGRNLVGLSEKDLVKIRGKGIGTIFQDPMSSLNPTMKVGDQIAEVRVVHMEETWSAGRKKALELLKQVGIPNPESRMDAFPHQLSGGMKQRVMIAMAIACDPRLLIADEPTTALDVTIQAEILELLKELRDDRGMSILLVTHDLGVVAENADRTVVMYAGQIAERAATRMVFTDSRHPYTRALVGSVPQEGESRLELNVIPGRVPPVGTFPSGCRFFERCEYAVQGRCDATDVTAQLEEAEDRHATSCVRWKEIFGHSQKAVKNVNV